MSFEEKKVPQFEHPIADLADQPNMQPGELKAYFDANPEILRLALNALCDSLNEITAADVGFAQTAGVPEENVQDAIENVQAQVTAAIMGNIPSGSVTGDKLAQDVRNRFSAIESAATTEATTRASADSNLQSQINTHTTQIAAKCEVYIGSYEGNDAAERAISLGFYPQAVFLISSKGNTTSERYYYGGMALREKPCGQGADRPGIVLTSSGFTIYNATDFDNYYYYRYYNRQGISYYYIAFR